MNIFIYATLFIFMDFRGNFQTIAFVESTLRDIPNLNVEFEAGKGVKPFPRL